MILLPLQRKNRAGADNQIVIGSSTYTDVLLAGWL